MSVEFVSLLDYDDYEILTVYPFTIRRKDNHYEVSECINGNGYVSLSLNQKIHDKHALIAKQFIPNPNNLPCIDHINRDKTDYHLSNLRWVSSSDNNKNKTSHKGVDYIFVDKISDEAIVVNEYKNHEFENYYYDETTDKFYYFNGFYYRELHVCEIKNKHAVFVNMLDTDNVRVRVYYNTFKRLYDLL